MQNNIWLLWVVHISSQGVTVFTSELVLELRRFLWFPKALLGSLSFKSTCCFPVGTKKRVKESRPSLCPSLITPARLSVAVSRKVELFKKLTTSDTTQAVRGTFGPLITHASSTQKSHKIPRMSCLHKTDYPSKFMDHSLQSDTSIISKIAARNALVHGKETKPAWRCIIY